tara:strand:- start:761 stop:910 length:150 start_codon:yes stop_codon:yes gene_type:complete
MRKYMNRSFYVKPQDVEELHVFQEKCKKAGHRSYSEVLVELIKNYNKTN